MDNNLKIQDFYDKDFRQKLLAEDHEIIKKILGRQNKDVKIIIKVDTQDITHLVIPTFDTHAVNVNTVQAGSLGITGSSGCAGSVCTSISTGSSVNSLGTTGSR